MSDIGITFEELAPGFGIWKAKRGKSYLGMIVRHSDSVYASTSGGVVHKQSSNLAAAKKVLKEAIESDK